MRHLHRALGLGASVLALSAGSDAAIGQTNLPQINVSQPKQTAKRAPARRVVRRPATGPTQATPAPTAAERAAAAAAERTAAAARELAARTATFDQARSNIYTTIGTTSATISHDTIDALPAESL